jgi:hypothetical protein
MCWWICGPLEEVAAPSEGGGGGGGGGTYGGLSGGEISAEGRVGVEELEVLLEELVDLRGELCGHCGGGGGGGRWCSAA